MTLLKITIIIYRMQAFGCGIVRYFVFRFLSSLKAHQPKSHLTASVNLSDFNYLHLFAPICTYLLQKPQYIIKI